MPFTQKASNIDVKRINKIRIARAILESEKVSHQELAAKLGLSVPTVLQNVRELMEQGIVREMGAFQSTGGRKAKAIAPVPDARMAVGVDITQNHVSAVLVDLTGKIVEYVRQFRPFTFHDDYFRALADTVEGLLEKAAAPRDKILGVGFSIPGIIDKSGEWISSSHVLGFGKVPCQIFSRFLPYPSVFLNDANAAGFAELRGGEPDRNAVYLFLSNSVGGAVLLSGKLYTGENQRGGEFGHNTLVPGGRKCYCGKQGCLDAYCSAKLLSDHTGGNLAAFFEQLKAGDQKIQKVWENYFDCLCLAVNNLRMTFDCDVIIGGYVGGYLEDFQDSLRERLQKLNTFEPSGDYLKICRYRLEASALGAALQFVEKFINQL